MKIAFYAPLKSPISGTPSGDRLIARQLMACLSDAGHDIATVSRFRSYDGDGNAERQRRLRQIGRKLADRVCRQLTGNRPDLWFTYHLYHKAPDWIGPHVCRAFGIPYVVAEASFAPKQEKGLWAPGHEAVRDTLRQTRLAIGLTRTDRACVEPCLPTTGKYLQLPPFLDWQPFVDQASGGRTDRRKLSDEYGVDTNLPWLLCVAMMRPGDKTESYRILATSLARIGSRKWQLLVVGDGANRDLVQSFFAPLGGRVFWLGRQSRADLVELYKAADIFVWPAVKETPGMCFLEAGAAGLPVVGGNGFGVPDVVIDGQTGLLAKHLDVTGFADKLAFLLDHPSAAREMGKCARQHIRSSHDISVAGGLIDRALRDLVP